jgi:hypothetical protein
MFHVCGGKCLWRKEVHSAVEKTLKDVRKSQISETEVRKWLRQQSEDFYAAGFDAVVKRWDLCSSFDGGYVEK